MTRTLHFVEDMEPEALAERCRLVMGGLPGYWRRIAARGVGINFATYVGHTAARLWVLGDDAFEREATADEIEAMCELVAGAVDAGAIGFSTDRSSFHRGRGRLVPSFYGSQGEVEALMRAAAARAAGSARPSSTRTRRGSTGCSPSSAGR